MLNRAVNNKILKTSQPLFLRPWSTAAQEASKKPKSKTQETKIPKEMKPSKQVQQYFELENPAILDLFPVKMLRNKQRTPDGLYVCHKNAVKPIIDQLQPRFDKAGRQIPLIEVNPGPGLVTTALLKKGYKKLLLFEASDALRPNLETLCADHPKRTQLKHADFLNLWKLVYQDKLDHGDRVAQLLNGLTKRNWDGDFAAQIFASVGSVNFFKHLINSIVFQSSLLSYGRCEMILCLPPPLFIHLTCSNQAGYLMYRSTTMLFQIMFEHEFLGKIPREYFLPWQVSPDLRSRNKLSKVKSIDPDFMYLVKVVPRKELYELCQTEHMQALWYFVKQHAVSRKSRVIPTLEHWIPGSGFRLITNTEPVVQAQPLSETTPSDLPPMCTAATTMSTQDFLPDINIFTQFGDLTPSQMLTLFDQFHKWPEYTQQCPFVSAMETSFIKMEASADQNVDGIQDEDDVVDSQEKSGSVG